MNKSVSEGLVGVDVLAECFLKLLQRDSVISNNTYLAAIKKLKEEQDVNFNEIFEDRD